MMMISDLPDDLESEILARVPAKSLSELKTTCKRWYALFRDPKFVEKNKKKSKSARESMLLSNHEVYSIAGDLHSSGDIAQPLEFTGKLSKDLDLYTISHCNGLMLCQAKKNTSVVVWNPCTGERKMIEPRTRYGMSDRFALGYDDSRRGYYKILRCRYYRKEAKVIVVETEMYDLSSSGSWRVLDSFRMDYGMYCSGVSLRGDTYFVAGNGEMGFFLLKFDFTEEKFVRLPLPFQSFDPEDTAVLSVVRDEKLSVCHQDILAWSNVMRIWVSNKVEGKKELSWRKDFVLTVDFDKFQLPCVVNVASFLLDEEKKVAVCCDTCDEEMKGEERDRIYIVGEDMYKQVFNDDTLNASLLCSPLVLTYVPSLICFH